MNLEKWKERVERKILAVLTALIITLPSFAQDKLAKTGPIDRRMRSIDSVVIKRSKIFEEITNPSENLYTNWANTYVRYTEKIPNEYKIDLRKFNMPCNSNKITSHFGYRSNFGRNHYGVDIKVYVGDTIYAAFSGKIRVVTYEAKGYGKYIVIRHYNGLETYYAHLSKQLVKPNQIVKEGQPIGLGGNTGRSTGSHLHFETRLLGKCINPEALFNFSLGDINGDFYIFRNNGNGELLGNREKMQKKEIIPNNIYVVAKDNETIASVSKKCKTTVSNICKQNGLKTFQKLRKNQIIKY